MAESGKRTVLITGCSDGGMGAELVKSFHKAGLHVYATARNPAKMAALSTLGDGVELKTLDISSQASIDACVKEIPRLDILINNAGASYAMTMTDMSISEAKALFDLNVWGHIAMVQAFMPLLLKSPRAMIVNHTSTAAHTPVPYHGAYAASKAAMSMFTNVMRLELEGSFNISVVELKTGAVNTEIVKNARGKGEGKQLGIPSTSIYAPAKSLIDPQLSGDFLDGKGIKPDVWAKGVVADLLKSSPPSTIWRGESASQVKMLSVFPTSWFVWILKKVMGVTKVEKVLQQR